jgi:hypothetical protein
MVEVLKLPESVTSVIDKPAKELGTGTPVNAG